MSEQTNSLNLDPTRLEAILPALQELPGAVLVLDGDGVVRYLNRIAEHRIDQASEIAIGRDLFRDVLPVLEANGYGERFRRSMENRPASLAWEATIGPPSDRRRLGFGVRSIETDQGPLGLVLLEDRSTLALEAERRRKAERLAGVGELAAGAAHEINNPLASIKGFAQLLARETLDRGQQQALEIISQECSRVARIVDNLLDFATQQRIAESERFDLSRVVESVIALKRYALETSGITIETDLDRHLSLVQGEKGALQRLVLILLNHAERSLVRKDGERLLTVRSCESNDGVVLYVTDNGPGFPRHRLARLLEEDNPQLDGLSLNSAHMIAKLYDGSLWIESGEGRGCTFTVRLPRADTLSLGKDEAIAEVPPVEEVEEEESHPLRVLVADDEPTLRLALSMFLSRHGYQVSQAEDVDQARKLIGAEKFDVALIDVRMPGDGLTLLDQLDEDAKWKGRAILMTGDHTLTRVKAEIQSGRPHLTKPFDMLEAVRLVERIATGGTDKQRELTTWTSS